MNRSYMLAGLFAVVIILWMASGALLSNGPATPSDATVSEDTKSFRVKAQVVRSTPRATTLQLRGRTEAVRILELRAETIGRVVGLPAQEGSLVDAGAVICELDVRSREARLNEMKASVRQREMEYKAAKDLSGRGFRSETQAAAAQAELERAKADLRERELDLANTTIKAPFPALLDLYEVEVGTLMQIGDICAILVDQDPFLVVAQVSEQEIGRLSVGMAAQARLVTGEMVEGRIRLISTRAEATTRTFRMEIEVPNPDQMVFRDGVTAEITVPLETVSAHRISPALLSLNSEGELGVRIIVGRDLVRFERVTVVADEGDGVWVTGLPDEVTVITVGHDYVVDGQRVAVDLAQQPFANAPNVAAADPDNESDRPEDVDEGSQR